MSDLQIIIGGCVSAFGIGWAMGWGIKLYRRFFDLL